MKVAALRPEPRVTPNRRASPEIVLKSQVLHTTVVAAAKKTLKYFS